MTCWMSISSKSEAYWNMLWHPSLTGEDRLRIERVQKSALCIILGNRYKSYRVALKQLKVETLFTRRQRLCEKFAKKCFKHPKFSKWFKPNSKKSATRQNQSKLCDVYSRTDRYMNSPISFLTDLLNKL